MKTYDDKEVIKKIKNGEIDHFSTLVKQYESQIYQYVRARLFQKLDADDLVQNTFVSFYKVISRFDETKPVLPYLFQITKNELKMYYRSHKETVSLEDSLEMKTEQADFYAEDYSRVLEKLSDEQREILQLLEEGYSYEEIAQKYNRPINTIRTIIRRARLQVKKLYEDSSKTNT
jgi:RNA polymerase sigma-70 factor (ECF subfamily)